MIAWVSNLTSLLLFSNSFTGIAGPTLGTWIQVGYEKNNFRWSLVKLLLYPHMLVTVWLESLCYRVNKTSSNKSSFSQYLPLFWPVRQSRAAVEPNFDLSQYTPNYPCITNHMNQSSYVLWSFGLLSKQLVLFTQVAHFFTSYLFGYSVCWGTACTQVHPNPL